MVAAFEDAARRYGASVQVDIMHKYDAYRFAADLPIIQKLSATLRAMELDPQLQISGGGSDVNILAQRNIQLANVSIGYRDIHSTNEHIAVGDLNRAAELVARLLAV
jgi:tripeptide aminopeptidase